MTSFVILTAPRTGSSWLVDTLNSHPRIAAYSELFVPGESEREATYGRQGLPYFNSEPEARTSLGRVRKRIAYVNRVYSLRNGVDAVGFKLIYKQAKRNPGLLPYLALRRARVVHLIRSNVLDTVISWETARARQFFHARRGDEVRPVQVKLDVEALVQRLDHHEYEIATARSWIRNFHLPYTETFYEELTGSRGEEKLARILGFLGVEPTADDLDSPLIRMNPSSHSELIANYEEVRSALAGSRFEWMLR